MQRCLRPYLFRAILMRRGNLLVVGGQITRFLGGQTRATGLYGPNLTAGEDRLPGRGRTRLKVGPPRKPEDIRLAKLRLGTHACKRMNPLEHHPHLRVPVPVDAKSYVVHLSGKR